MVGHGSPRTFKTIQIVFVALGFLSGVEGRTILLEISYAENTDLDDVN